MNRILIELNNCLIKIENIFWIEKKNRINFFSNSKNIFLVGYYFKAFKCLFNNNIILFDLFKQNNLLLV